MNTKGFKINFLGDSITANAGASDAEHGYVAVASRLLELKEARNYGVNGTKIAPQPAEFETHEANWEDFYTRALRMDKDADAVFVFGGTNDFGHGRAPFGEFSDRTQDTFYGSLHVLMQYLLENYVGKMIVFATPIHRLEEDSDCGNGTKPKGSLPLSCYAEAIREVAAYYGIPVLDLMRVSMIQPQFEFIREKLCPDGLHPNDLGHQILGERVAGFFKSL